VQGCVSALPTATVCICLTAPPRQLSIFDRVHGVLVLVVVMPQTGDKADDGYFRAATCQEGADFALQAPANDIDCPR
jgi:hypothetical protein